MAKNILGIDIGTSSVKLLRYNKTLRGGEVTHFRKMDYAILSEKGDFNTQVTQAISQLIDDDILENDFIVSSVSSKHLIIRNITLPFADEKKIEGMIKYEIEPDTLFPIDTLLVDFLVVNKNKKASSTDLLVIGIEKKIVEDHLSILSEFNIEPDVIDIDSLSVWNSYSALFKQIPTDDDWGGDFSLLSSEGIVSLIDLGADKTSVNIMEDGNLIFTRTIPKAGNFITQNIMKGMGISFSEAEALKINFQENKDKKILNSLENSISVILKEIELTFFSYFSKLKEPKEQKCIYLTGGTSHLDEFKKRLASKFNINVLSYDLTPYLKDSHFDDYADERLFCHGVLGLVYRGGGKGKNSIDLRKEEFTLQKNYESVKGYFIGVGVLASVLLFLFCFNFYYHINQKEKKYEQLSSNVKKIFKEAFPDAKRVRNEVKTMEKKIKENEERLKSFGGAAGLQLSSLALLREVSAKTPDEIEIDLKEIVISQENIRLVGKIESFEALDSLKKSLQKSEYFSEIKVDNASAVEGESAVEFKASVSIQKNI